VPRWWHRAIDADPVLDGDGGAIDGASLDARGLRGLRLRGAHERNSDKPEGQKSENTHNTPPSRKTIINNSLPWLHAQVQ
jgi:hypothetical protein